MAHQRPPAPAPTRDGALFVSPAYLEPLTRHGCVGPAQGWRPVRLSLGTAADAAHAPCYEKSHSWGEFVFDFEIARAYQQHGLSYYPKLVCCVPYTPVPGPRLLGNTPEQRRALGAALVEQTERSGASGAHVLYLPEDEQRLLANDAWLPRDQLRFIWRNRGYRDFDDFLSAMTSKRRKNIRRERARVGEGGFEIRWCDGASFDPSQWQAIYALYASTYAMRGQSPYLTLGCLQDWAQAFGPRMRFCLALQGGEPVAMAFFFVDGRSLFGRHWGTRADYDALHFELCYYQGIDHCIEQGLERFDAGVQGEHKLLRGFEPERAHSAHWFAHDGMRAAIARYFDEERLALAARIDALTAHTGLRATPADNR